MSLRTGLRRLATTTNRRVRPTSSCRGGYSCNKASVGEPAKVSLHNMEALFIVMVSSKADERNAFNAALPLRYGHVLKKRYQAGFRYQYSKMFQLGILIRSGETSGDGAIETTSAT